MAKLNEILGNIRYLRFHQVKMIVKIARYFPYPDLKRQTPKGSMQWRDMTFTEADVSECDFLVILDYPKENFSVKVNPDNIIHIALEPPNEISKYRQYGSKQASVIFNQLDIKQNNILSHGALPWHLNKDYDFLAALQHESLEKENKVAWITSNQRGSKGHHRRMDFLETIQGLPFIELYGRGIRHVEDKWDVLQKSKYAIAYENYQSDHYWTEKISDCFLTYTMPLYFGCDSIEHFFPENSFIRIDPNDKHVALFLKEVVRSNKWEENLEAITTARNLVLNEYQLFPFLYNYIHSLTSLRGQFQSEHNKIPLSFKGGNAYFDNFPAHFTIQKNIIKIRKKLARIFSPTK